MSFSLAGDFAKIGAWRGKVHDAKRDAMEKVAKDVGETMISLVRDGFEAEADPYGDPWEQLKRREGRILQGPTGNLRTGWHRVSWSADHCTIGPSVDYAVYHQDGAPRANIPQRRMVPDNGNLPAHWGEECTRTARDVLDDYFNK